MYNFSTITVVLFDKLFSLEARFKWIVLAAFIQVLLHSSSNIVHASYIIQVNRFVAMFKDGGKEGKKKDPTSSFVKCFFIRMESIEKVYEARSSFMHAHRLPSVANYMARFSLILSKTTKVEVDLASVNIQTIEDVLCMDRDGKVVYEKPEKPCIHTDGTGFIYEDLALICRNNTNPRIVELESNLLAMQRQESKAQEPVC
ncbi:putative RNA-dependent RNA polymerase 5 [Castanea sativa]|uniref:putative RNA-dependent RNA polymerase 5 n=1 Tax=Castanea sativa TaxID=21020 RepID=UPI003F650588